MGWPWPGATTDAREVTAGPETGDDEEIGPGMIYPRRWQRRAGAAATPGARTVIDRVICLAQYAAAFGPLEGLRLFFLNRLRRGEFSFPVSGAPGRFVIRRDRADLCVFDQVFVEQQYRLEVPLDPGFIIDAGANVGFSSAYFALQYPRARIVAVEPEPSNFAQLQKNVRALKNVTCLQAALWPDTARLRIDSPDVESHAFRVQTASPGDATAPAVQAVTVDGILRQSGAEKVDLLKIDIEGAEKEIFSNAAPWIDRVGAIMIELHDGLRPGCSKAFWQAVGDREFAHYQKGEITTVFLVPPGSDGRR